MAKLSKQDVLKLARLARLHLSEDEINNFRSEIDTVLNYVEILQDVPLEDVTPTNQVTGLENVMRQDEVVEYGASPQELLKNAPAIEGNQIKVKRVL